MRIPRVYTDRALEVGALVELETEASHHLTRVLRLSVGAPIVVFDGGPTEFDASIDTVGRDRVRIRVLSAQNPQRESPIHIHLGQGISRGERMDYTVQKSVELGISEITPLWTARSQMRLDGDRLERKLGHWRGIIRSACEQSARLRIPSLHLATSPEQWAAQLPSDYLKLLLVPEADGSLRDLRVQPLKIALLIGPEGGLSPEEAATARSLGFTSVRLGPRVLRTETAAVAALSALQVLWGDLG